MNEKVQSYILHRYFFIFFYKKGIIKNFSKFTGKHLRQSLLFNKVAGRPATLLKKQTLTQVFS